MQPFFFGVGGEGRHLSFCCFRNDLRSAIYKSYSWKIQIFKYKNKFVILYMVYFLQVQIMVIERLEVLVDPR